MIDGFELRACRGKAGWEVIPRGVKSIDLDAVSSRIEQSGWDCTLRNRLCHTFGGEVNLTLYPSGKLMVKSNDLEAVDRIAELLIDSWIES